MSMDLREALERVDVIATAAQQMADEDMSDSIGQALDAEALRVVALAARENHVAKLVAEVNAATARAVEAAGLDVTSPHAFRSFPKNTLGFCCVCARDERHPIHDSATTP